MLYSSAAKSHSAVLSEPSLSSKFSTAAHPVNRVCSPLLVSHQSPSPECLTKQQKEPHSCISEPITPQVSQSCDQSEHSPRVRVAKVSKAGSWVGLVPSLLVLLLALRAVCAAGNALQIQSFPPASFQCHVDSAARQLHVLVSGGCWRGPETRPSCFLHVVEHTRICQTSVRSGQRLPILLIQSTAQPNPVSPSRAAHLSHTVPQPFW